MTDRAETAAGVNNGIVDHGVAMGTGCQLAFVTVRNGIHALVWAQDFLFVPLWRSAMLGSLSRQKWAR